MTGSMDEVSESDDTHVSKNEEQQLFSELTVAQVIRSHREGAGFFFG